MFSTYPSRVSDPCLEIKSKRLNTRMRTKIEKKIRQHHSKVRKLAKSGDLKGEG